MDKKKLSTEISNKYTGEKRIIIPFIGAGISRIVEDKNGKNILPDWDEFNEGLLSDISEIGKYGYFKNDPQEVAEYYIHRKTEIDKNAHQYSGSDEFLYGKSKLVEFMKKKLSVEFTNSGANYLVNGKESEKLEIRFALKEKFEIIYTTNWDNLLEKITGYKGVHLSSQLVISDVRKRKNVIIKFHGDINTEVHEEGNSLICCKTDYFRRILHENPFDLLFKNDLLHSDFLFMGYSFRDPNIFLVISEINELVTTKDIGSKTTVYWLVTDYKDNPRLKVMSNTNIQPVLLLPEDEQEKLKQQEKKLEKLCEDCRVDFNDINPKEHCKKCPPRTNMENELRKKEREVGYENLKKFINGLPKLY